MTTADGEDHRRLRSLVSRAFTARRVEELRPRIEELTVSLLDDLARAAASDGGVADLRHHFALPLPLGVICELLGSRTVIGTGCTGCPDMSSPPTSVRSR